MGRRVWASSLIVACAVTACGGSASKTAKPVNILVGAEAQLQQAKTFRIHMAWRETGPPRNGSIEPGTGTADGVIDYAHGRGEITADVRDQRTDRVEEAVFDGSVAYIHVRQSTGAKKWFKFSFGTAQFLPFGDPAGTLRELRQAATAVQRAGYEAIDGTRTTHYRVTIPAGRRFSAALAQPTDAWVDDQGRLRRLRLTELTKSKVTGTVTIDVSDFGTPVHVVTPPADQVTTFDASVPGVKPAGSWSLAASGNAEGVSWQVWRVAAGAGEVCLSVHTEPDLGGLGLVLGRDGSGSSATANGAITYRARPANCIPDPAVPTSGNDLYTVEPFQLFDADGVQAGAGTHYVAALVEAGATNVVAHFSDGTAQRLDPAPDGTVFAMWRGFRRLQTVDLDAPTFGSMRCTGSEGAAYVDDPSNVFCNTR